MRTAHHCLERNELLIMISLNVPRNQQKAETPISQWQIWSLVSAVIDLIALVALLIQINTGVI